MPRPEFLHVAQLSGTHGVKGEMKARPLTEDPLRLQELKEVSALLQDGSRRSLRPYGVHLRGDGVLLLRFEGFDSPEAAAPLKGAYLQVPYAEAKRAPGQILYADLIGLQAVHAESGEAIGEVQDLLVAAQELLEIRLPDGKELLIPWVDHFVKVDMEGGRVLISPIEGLLEA